MVSPHDLRSTFEAALLGPSPPTPSQRIELLHAVRCSVPLFKSFLSYPGPKASDRTEVESKEVRIPGSSPILLDDTDVQIALKLSDDLNLNEIECVRLLVAANSKWVLFGREPLEILRLTAGLWYMERRDLIASLHALLRTVIVDEWLDADLISDIHKHLEDIFSSGLGQRLIFLIKELNREESAGLGGPSAEKYVLDFRGAIIERRAVVAGERLSLSHCLVLSILILQMTPKDVKDVFSILKDCCAEANSSTTHLQIIFSLLFTLIISLITDALNTAPEKPSKLFNDSSFGHEFHDLIMAPINDPNVEGFIDCVRFGWMIHVMIVQERSNSRATSGALPIDLADFHSCLEHVCSHNVFRFFLSGVLQTAAYQNQDEHIIYMYNGYLHKLMMCFLSYPLSRDKVKDMKDKAMSAISPYLLSGDRTLSSKQVSDIGYESFVSLLEFISEIYQKEPELLYGNEELWAFIHFAGEDHTNIHTLVAFLKLLGTLASTEEGASKVYELLHGKIFRSIGWSTLFDCLSIYDGMFKQALQTSGNLLPDIQEGDAQALVGYLNVLQKVVENGNPSERRRWFQDIEPLFKLLGYENVPPYLKSALRNAIASFIKVSPALKDTIWNYLEQYDLPVAVAPFSPIGQHAPSQIYDMQFELNEVEARRERYPSTISFLNLLNTLIAQEKDESDRGRRFVGIFRFVYDHVFGPFPQRAYADPYEKWQLVLSCLQHFQMVLKMYNINKEESGKANNMSLSPGVADTSTIDSQIPALELLKDFMSGKTAFCNIMSIISLGADIIISERTSQSYGQLLEEAVKLSLEILVLVMDRDIFLADFWRPLYQPLDVILSQNPNWIFSLLEYIRYDFSPQIQQNSIKIMSILSSRMIGLVQLLLKSNAAKCLVEDYAACLESRFEECESIENAKDDLGVLILQLLIDNINRPAPNVAHLLLRFDIDSPVEHSILQPKVHYSCLKVMLDNLEKLSRPDINTLLHEFGFQLLYELCMDPLTSGPTMYLLSTKKYLFFSKHLDTICTNPLPKRSHNQSLRVSMLHERAWLIKLLALELHTADMGESTHREACLSILSLCFTQIAGGNYQSPELSRTSEFDASNFAQRTTKKKKVLELLDVVQFRTPDIGLQCPQLLPAFKFDAQVNDILKSSSTSEKGGVYYYSERGDRLLDLDALHEKLWQLCSQGSYTINDAEKTELRASIQQFLRWAWRYNKNLEEQAAQLHMLSGWSQIVEVSISKRMLLLEDRSQILFELLGASLSASASPDCTLRMAYVLSNVALTCMAKLRDERFLCPGGVDSDSVTCLDIISVKQLSNGACHSILYKLMMAILRNESSETLRRRQYALLLGYFQYCRSILNPDVPASILRYLLSTEHDDDDELNLQKIGKEQAELEGANFSIIKKEAQAIINLVTKDAMQGSEVGKPVSCYVLDAFLSIDRDKFFLNQLQSRGILRSCLTEINNFSCKDALCSLESQQRLCTLEAQLSLLLRVSDNYGKHGAQILLSMGALDQLGSSKAVLLQSQGTSRWYGTPSARDRLGEADKKRLLVIPVLRLVSSLTSLVESSEYLEVKNKIVREVLDFVKGHQSTFNQILKEDISDADELTLERSNLVVSILSKVWPYEENDEYGFVQELFSMMHILFRFEFASSNFAKSSDALENQKSEFLTFHLCFSLSSYLYSLLKRKLIRLQTMDSSGDRAESGAHQHPTLYMLLGLLNSVTTTLERSGEEKFLLLNKIQDINELSRLEVDEVITLCMKQGYVSSSDNIRKRRYIAMIEMCRMAGNRDQLITLLLQLAELILNILLFSLQDEISDLQSSFSDNMHPILDRIEQLKEDKIGHSLKFLQRTASILKDILIRSIAI
ncbi:nuclear pore complex protein NUP205-like isoform X2 [Zingiber officinale]|uniref:nuclear pore complex protein NUP205-like isoform X2 n=1 Tax=Zingiber officinale TaxID=94328 RepID=UPI001C4C9171|nr:nuclear pore complex protein NUP205-like isoform X2 [Zingiber officinale]